MISINQAIWTPREPRTPTHHCCCYWRAFRRRRRTGLFPHPLPTRPPPRPPHPRLHRSRLGFRAVHMTRKRKKRRNQPSHRQNQLFAPIWTSEGPSSQHSPAFAHKMPLGRPIPGPFFAAARGEGPDTHNQARSSPQLMSQKLQRPRPPRPAPAPALPPRS